MAGAERRAEAVGKALPPGLDRGPASPPRGGRDAEAKAESVKDRLCAEKSEGRGGSAAKQVPPQPSPAPTLGLRAQAMAFSLYRRPALERRRIMVFSSCLRNGERSALAARRRTQTSPRQRAGFRPRLEALEDRTVPSGYQQLNLVGAAQG